MDFGRDFNQMPKASQDVPEGTYIATVHIYDAKHNLTGRMTVKPIRVYRSGARRSIGWLDKNGQQCVRDCWPGATTFELYKQV